MNKGKIFLRIFLIMLFIASVALLTVALTDIYHNPKLEKYGFIIGLGVISVIGLLKQEFQGNKKHHSEK